MTDLASSRPLPLPKGLTQRIEVLLSGGFRSFFLLTALHAGLSVLLWMAWLAAQSGPSPFSLLPLSSPMVLWHAHEMVFGFLSAAIAGFLLTAVPNWTGTKPVSGRPLAILVAVWILGRLAFWTSSWWPTWLIVAADMPFLPLLAVIISRSLRHSQTRRNLPFIPLLFALAAANIADHFSILGLLPINDLGQVIAIDCVAVMMVIIGGRITPTFSRNWLLTHQRTAPEATPLWLDRAAMGGAFSVVVSDLLGGLADLDLPFIQWASTDSWLRSALAGVTGLILLVRLLQWQPWRVRDVPLLWVLHLGMTWLAVGFLLRSFALAPLPDLFGFTPPDFTSALHAQLVGAAGTLILGIMGRASLAHSGHPLKASHTMTVSYVLVFIAALARVFGPTLWPQQYLPMVLISATLWCFAFILFFMRFAPLLSAPEAPTIPLKPTLNR